jgi:succinate dehydrogenase / fumarate reductase, cytochrome b subunit
MSNFFNASVGKKFLVSLSGLFLITFLAVHLTVNMFLLFGPEAYNSAAHFMATNPIIKVMEPMLGIGFLLHILYALVLTIANLKARPDNYQMVDQSETSSWASRNMFVLGSLIFIFLVLHLSNFWFKMKFGEMQYIDYEGIAMQDAYSLVTGKFVIWWYVLIYVAGAVFLGFHLLHGFQSAFQTIGLNNQTWRKRWTFLGTIYSVVIAAGFSLIPLYFLIKAYLS